MSEEQNEFGNEIGRLFEEFTKALHDDNVEKASTTMNALWVMFQIAAVGTTTDLKELTYLKTPFVFNNGGTYLLTFTHVDGPKIQFADGIGEAYTKPFEEKK